MSVATIIVVIFVVLPGLIGLVAPTKLVGLVKNMMSPKGRFVAGSIRLVIGASLWFSADSSRNPEMVQLFGGLLFASGIVTLAIGQQVFERLIGWFASWNPAAIRIWGVVALLFGVWLISLL